MPCDSYYCRSAYHHPALGFYSAPVGVHPIAQFALFPTLVLMRKPINTVPLHASSHVETCLIHHLSWAAVAVAWLMAIGDPLTPVPDRESSPQNPLVATGTVELSEQRVPNTAEDCPRSPEQTTSFLGGGKMAAKTEVNALGSHGGRCLNMEETLEFISQMERVPLSNAEKRDLAEILNPW